jgi:hypothetical protein
LLDPDSVTATHYRNIASNPGLGTVSLDPNPVFISESGFFFSQWSPEKIRALDPVTVMVKATLIP